jgi:hypothetical protein
MGATGMAREMPSSCAYTLQLCTSLMEWANCRSMSRNCSRHSMALSAEHYFRKLWLPWHQVFSLAYKRLLTPTNISTSNPPSTTVYFSRPISSDSGSRARRSMPRGGRRRHTQLTDERRKIMNLVEYKSRPTS